MVDEAQLDLLSPIGELRLVQFLLADLHDDLSGKISRFRQLNDLSMALGSYGTMLPGGEIAHAAWTEARTSFIHGNYVATVMLCQSLAEHLLAAHIAIGIQDEKLPSRVSLQDTVERFLAAGFITRSEADDLFRLSKLRNPLTHFRDINDPSNLTRRVMSSGVSADRHLFSDASFAIGVAVRLLALPLFRVDNRSLADE